MYVLADYLVKDSKASFVAGIIFAFSAFHMAQAVHIHFINIEWAPLFAYFLLRAIDERNDYWNILGMGVTFALSTLASNIEVSLIMIWILPMVFVYDLVSKERRGRVLNRWFAIVMILFAVTAFVAGSWNYVPIASAVLRGGGITTADYLNSPVYNALWSDNIFAFFVPSYYNGIAYALGISKAFYNTIYFNTPTEQIAYIGYSVLVLAIYGLYRNRKETKMWLAGAIVFGLLCLGPIVQVWSYILNIQDGLFALYRLIPYISVVREPGRFQLLFTMCVAVMAAFGFRDLDRKIAKERARIGAGWQAHAVTAVISLIILAELAGLPLGAQFIRQTTTTLSVPRIYGELGSIGQNFSVLELPTLILNTSTPALYSGTATYYTSIYKKPLIGGDLGGRENESDEDLLYSIPLVMQDSAVLSYGIFGYIYPVEQNYTNQTLLSLYNYGTAVVILQKQAYNSTDLNSMAGYLLSTFGSPVYNDNTTVAFLTANAIDHSVYRSYVAYPALEDWKSENATVNGKNTILWSPIYPGAVDVYAPYQNTSDVADEINSTVPSSINTQISFVAGSKYPQRLTLNELQPGGKYTELAEVNLTATYTRYVMNVTLQSGPNGNPLLFMPQYGYKNHTVYMWNLNFSRAG